MDLKRSGGVIREVGEGAGPRPHGADLAFEHRRGVRPVEAAIGLDEGTGERGGVRLRAGGEGAVEEGVQVVGDEMGGEFGEARCEGFRSMGGKDGERGGGEDGTGIEAGFHAHEGDAGDGVAVEDGGGDGIGAAIVWQKGGVEVDAPVSGKIEDPAAEDEAEGRHDDQIGGEIRDVGADAGIAEGVGLEDREIEV